MRLTDCLRQFFDGTGMIFDPVRLKGLGLFSDNISGFFWPSQVEELIEFCAANPKYHIVSYMGDWIYINRYDKNGGVFSLADGDADPSYMLNRKYSENLIPTIKQR